MYLVFGMTCVHLVVGKQCLARASGSRTIRNSRVIGKSCVVEELCRGIEHVAVRELGHFRASGSGRR